MDVTEIVKAYEAYYENAGQNKSRILSMLTQGLETPKYCTPVKTDDTIFRLSQITVGNLVQAFQKSWTPKPAHKFTPNELRLYKLKVDDDLYPDDIEATWLGFLAGDTNIKKEWPLIKFLIEHPDQGYIAAINRDMESLEYGHGVFAEPTEGTASITGQSMDGIIIQLKRGVENETMNSVPIGELDKDTIFDQVELFVDGISEVYQNMAMNVFMSPKWFRYYHRDKRMQAFYAFPSEANVNQLSNRIDFTPQQVVPLPSLSGSDVIFATPKPNFLHLTKRSANKTQFNIQESKRIVNLMVDWWEGIGFGINEVVWTNILPGGSGSVPGSD